MKELSDGFFIECYCQTLIKKTIIIKNSWSVNELLKKGQGNLWYPRLPPWACHWIGMSQKQTFLHGIIVNIRTLFSTHTRTFSRVFRKCPL